MHENLAKYPEMRKSLSLNVQNQKQDKTCQFKSSVQYDKTNLGSKIRSGKSSQHEGKKSQSSRNTTESEN